MALLKIESSLRMASTNTNMMMENAMKRKDSTTREITFYSKKNKKTISVFGKAARALADRLECDDEVIGYISKVPMGINTSEVPLFGIRQSYIGQLWISDFAVALAGRRTRIIEAITAKELGKRAEVEKLELSRRYWSQKGIEWRLYIDDESEKEERRG